MYLFRKISTEDELGCRLEQVAANEAGQFISLNHEDFSAPPLILLLRYLQFQDTYLFHERSDIVDMTRSFLLSLGEPYEKYLKGINSLQHWEKLTFEKVAEFAISFLTKGVGGGSSTFDDLKTANEFWNDLICWIGEPRYIFGNWKKSSPYSGGEGFGLFKGKSHVHDEGFILISEDKIALLFFFGED
jgi:hypothetical protein